LQCNSRPVATAACVIARPDPIIGGDALPHAARARPVGPTLPAILLRRAAHGRAPGDGPLPELGEHARMQGAGEPGLPFASDRQRPEARLDVGDGPHRADLGGNQHALAEPSGRGGHRGRHARRTPRLCGDPAGGQGEPPEPAGPLARGRKRSLLGGGQERDVPGRPAGGLPRRRHRARDPAPPRTHPIPSMVLGYAARSAPESKSCPTRRASPRAGSASGGGSSSCSEPGCISAADLRDRVAALRRRPRRTGKPL
jgi:hypothetical protein